MNRAYLDISQLAGVSLPGALVLAEQAVDVHASQFLTPRERLTALDALTRDLMCLAVSDPSRAEFLRQVDSYIELLRLPLQRYLDVTQPVLGSPYPKALT